MRPRSNYCTDTPPHLWPQHNAIQAVSTLTSGIKSLEISFDDKTRLVAKQSFRFSEQQPHTCLSADANSFQVISSPSGSDDVYDSVSTDHSKDEFRGGPPTTALCQILRRNAPPSIQNAASMDVPEAVVAELARLRAQSRKLGAVDGRAYFNTLFLSVFPKKEEEEREEGNEQKSSSQGMGAPQPKSHLPDSLGFDQTFAELSKLLARLIHHVLGDDPCLMEDFGQAEGEIRRRRRSPMRTKHDFQLAFENLPAWVTCEIVVALGKKFKEKQYSLEGKDLFQKLGELLPSLQSEENWPVEFDQMSATGKSADISLKDQIGQSILVHDDSMGKDKPSTLPQYHSDVYYEYSTGRGTKQVAGVLELRKFHQSSADDIWSFFRPKKVVSEAADKEDITEKRKGKFAADSQRTAVISQLFSYNLCEGFPQTMFCPGPFLLFLWVEFETAQSYYFCTSGKPYRNYENQAPHGTERGKLDSAKIDKGAWDPADAVSCIVAALLRGIDDRNSRDKDKRADQAVKLWENTQSVKQLEFESQAASSRDGPQTVTERSSEAVVKTAHAHTGVGKGGFRASPPALSVKYDKDEDQPDDGGSSSARKGPPLARGSATRGNRTRCSAPLQSHEQAGATVKGRHTRTTQQILEGSAGQASSLDLNWHGPSCADASLCKVPTISIDEDDSERQVRTKAAPEEAADDSFGSDNSSGSGNSQSTLFDNCAGAASTPLSPTPSLYNLTSHLSKDDKKADGSPSCSRQSTLYLGRSERLPTIRFCSEQCLATLKRGIGVDLSCPNIKLHCGAQRSDRTDTFNGVVRFLQHPISADQVAKDLATRLQMGRITDVMEPILGCRGHSAQLFRVVHPGFGYAFAAKGVHHSLSKSLDHEAAIYAHIWDQANKRSEALHDNYPVLCTLNEPSEQGLPAKEHSQKQLRIQTPICFGVIKPEPKDLEVMYPLWPWPGHVRSDDAKAYNTFLLLSYHDQWLLDEAIWDAMRSQFSAFTFSQAHKDQVSMRMNSGLSSSSVDFADLTSLGEHCEPALQWLVDKCKTALASFGVIHNDLDRRNLLWSRDLNSVLAIDFGHSNMI